MNIKKLLVVFMTFLTLFLFWNKSIYAASCSGAGCLPPVILSITDLFTSLTTAFVAVSIVVLFIILIIAGYYFITAGGEKEKIDKAKKSLLFSILGFSIIFIPFVLIPLIINLTIAGGNITIRKNGDLQANINSTFTATPIPTSLVDTRSNTPIPTNTPLPTGGNNGGPGGPTVNDNVPHISQVLTYNTLADLAEEYDVYGAVPDGRGGYKLVDPNRWIYYSCVEASIGEVINGYAKFGGKGDDVIEISQIMDFARSKGWFIPYAGTAWPSNQTGYETTFNSLNSNDGLTYKWVDYHTDIANIDTLKKALVNNTPVFVHINYDVNWLGHVMVITGISGNNVLVADPVNPGAASYPIDQLFGAPTNSHVNGNPPNHFLATEFDVVQPNDTTQFPPIKF